MKLVKSWDIFDTIIARKCVEFYNIFSLVELKTGFPDYKKHRLLAEKLSDGTFDNIYFEFQKLANCSVDIVEKLREEEINTEKEQLFLIREIYDQISDGDILVSDMYLSKEIIHELLKHVGFDKKVEIFVSYKGKRDGQIWSTIRNCGYSIVLHTGDNLHSDVNKPQEYGIPTQYFPSSKLTKSEQYLRENGNNALMEIVRYIRLNDNYP